MKKGNPIALLPIGVFLVLYLGLGLLFEYGLHIPMGFYNIPIVIAFLVAILVACLQNRAVPFEEKLVIMGQGVGDKNIITMLLIFLTAGAFVGVVGAQLRPERRLLHARHHPRPVRRGGAVCGCLLCLHRHGNLRRHHHPHHAHCIGGRPGVRL